MKPEVMKQALIDAQLDPWNENHKKAYKAGYDAAIAESQTDEERIKPVTMSPLYGKHGIKEKPTITTAVSNYSKTDEELVEDEWNLCDIGEFLRNLPEDYYPSVVKDTISNQERIKQMIFKAFQHQRDFDRDNANASMLLSTAHYQAKQEEAVKAERERILHNIENLRRGWVMLDDNDWERLYQAIVNRLDSNLEGRE
jgi:hypothetical protein